MYDVFISYRRDGGFEMARLLYEHLKNIGIRVFLDLEELRSGQFNTGLYDAISSCENFIIVLSHGALDRCCDEGDWMRLEIEHALKESKNIIPISLHSFDFPKDLPETLARLPLYNGITISNEYFDASMRKLHSMLKCVPADSDMLSDDQTTHKKERTENTYFSSSNKKEVLRLKTQQQLIKKFDRAVYEKAIEKFDELKILDVGSNNGDHIMDRIGYHNKVVKLLGLECDEDAVAYANEKYGQANRISFIKLNVEDDCMLDYLFEEMENNNIDSFNVVNISMLLLHLKNPYKLLKNLRKVLSDGGIIIIKDIDDGLNLAYPDEDGSFDRIFRICYNNETSGYRHSGRQVPTLLSRSGYKNISVEKIGVNTLSMTFDERSALFDTYFSFVLEDLQITADRHPESKRIQDDLQWYKSKYEEIEEKFQDNALFFLLGFILFSAEK